MEEDNGEVNFNVARERQLLREQYIEQVTTENPSPRLQFEYACLLLCSSDLDETREAIELFSELLQIGFNRSECLYQVALAYFKLGEYNSALKRVEMLMKLEPRNLAALSLHSLIVHKTSHDGFIGVLFVLTISLGCLFYLYHNYKKVT